MNNFMLTTIGTGVFGGIDGRFYGGDQRWYDRAWQRNGGCGPTAAANIMAYLSRRDAEHAGLYPYNDLSKPAFSSYMNDVCAYVTPGHIGDLTWGYWHEKSFGKDTARFARDRGVSLIPASINKKNADYNSAHQFIADALSLNSPVAVIIHFNRKIESNFIWHWMTITGLEGTKAAMSSWGAEYRLDMRDIWLYSSYAGLIYFC